MTKGTNFPITIRLKITPAKCLRLQFSLYWFRLHPTGTRPAIATGFLAGLPNLIFLLLHLCGASLQDGHLKNGMFFSHWLCCCLHLPWCYGSLVLLLYSSLWYSYLLKLRETHPSICSARFQTWSVVLWPWLGPVDKCHQLYYKTRGSRAWWGHRS